MSMVYQWRPGSRFSTVDAQTAGERLAKLEEQNGQLTAQIVVDDARPEAAPLHSIFEWDDSIAAEKYREEQARHVIRSVVVTEIIPNQQRPVRAFVHIQKQEDVRSTSERTYANTMKVFQDEELREQVIKRARRELMGWHQRYNEFVEFSQTVAAIEKEVLVAV